MAIYGFNDLEDARTLKKFARERRSNPIKGTGVEFPDRPWNFLKAYVVSPKQVIPGARRVGGKVFLGSGICCVYEREKKLDEDHSIRPESTVNSTELIPRLDDNGDRVNVRVFNLCPETIQPSTSCKSGSHADLGCEEPLLFAVSDIWGDLYIVKECSFPCSSSSGSFSSSAASSSAPSSSRSSSYQSSSFGSSSAPVSSSSCVQPEVVMGIEADGCGLKVQLGYLSIQGNQICITEGPVEEVDLTFCCTCQSSSSKDSGSSSSSSSSSGEGSASASAAVSSQAPVSSAAGSSQAPASSGQGPTSSAAPDSSQPPDSSAGPDSSAAPGSPSGSPSTSPSASGSPSISNKLSSASGSPSSAFDYVATGAGFPCDTANGGYNEAGDFAGKPYYTNAESWVLWWNAGPDRWVVSTILGGGSTLFYRFDTGPVPPTGEYTPQGGCSGILVLS